MMQKFAAKMTSKSWSMSFNKSGTNLTVREMRKTSLGGDSLFGQVNLGFFLDHGSYGTTTDFHTFANQSKQTYFPSDNSADNSNPWIGLSEFGFDGGNLRWMAMLPCNSLFPTCYSSMVTQGVFPIKTGNHLLCGATTATATGEDIGEIWATKMLGSFLSPKLTIKDAWFAAGQKQYSYATNITHTITFRVAGWSDCMNDKLDSYSATTTGGITKVDQQVYP
jgi:hypothetical protein